MHKGRSQPCAGEGHVAPDRNSQRQRQVFHQLVSDRSSLLQISRGISPKVVTTLRRPSPMAGFGVPVRATFKLGESVNHQVTTPIAAFVLRVSLGILFLAHAGLKIFVFTLPGTAE